MKLWLVTDPVEVNLTAQEEGHGEWGRENKPIWSHNAKSGLGIASGLTDIRQFFTLVCIFIVVKHNCFMLEFCMICII